MTRDLVSLVWNGIEGKPDTPSILRDFNFPGIVEPTIKPSLPPPNTACFDWLERRPIISDEFLKSLEGKLKFKPSEQRERAIRGILEHEVSHWHFFPRDLATKLFLLSSAEPVFGEKTSEIYSWYADLACEGGLFASGISTLDILAVRKALSDEPGAGISKILLSMYHHTFGEQFSCDIRLSPEETAAYEKIKDKVPYIKLEPSGHLASMYLFGKAIEKLIPTHPKIMALGGTQQGAGLGSGGLEGIPHKELEGALAKILHAHGAGGYKDARAFVRRHRPDFTGTTENRTHEKQAGLEPGEYSLHNEMIPMYVLWARGYGLYIVKKPMKKDSTSTFRSGYKEFEVGDPITNTAVFASRGIIGIPGISKVHCTEEESTPKTDFCVPDLNVGIDSSGSMDAPDARTGAVQVLAGFILGKNYHANGARVCGWNFSTDIVTTPLSRDLEPFYSLMCARWGGGTFINIPKLFMHLSNIHMTESAARRFYANITESSEKRMFTDKNLRVDMTKVRENAQKIDNVLITDGYLANPEEVITHLSQLGKITRNFVFLTERAKYDEWKKINLHNTWVYLADTSASLTNLAVGLSRRLVTDTSS